MAGRRGGGPSRARPPGVYSRLATGAQRWRHLGQTAARFRVPAPPETVWPLALDRRDLLER
jgi:hypothetical protein